MKKITTEELQELAKRAEDEMSRFYAEHAYRPDDFDLYYCISTDEFVVIRSGYDGDGDMGSHHWSDDRPIRVYCIPGHCTVLGWSV